MKTVKEFAVPALTLFLISLIATFLLALTNDVTAPKIAELAVQTEINSRKQVFADAASFGDETVLAGNEDCSAVPALDAQGNTIGYVIVTVEKGYGGDIKVMTGVGTDGKVKGLNILELSETAGLGMNAQNEEFRNQFIGLSSGITVSKDKPGENSIDAITGATITSRAVTKAVNLAITLAGGENIG